MIGKTVSRYRIVAKLGAGGMGEVFRARDEQLARDVAVKVLPAALSADRELLARFAREARAVGRLNHPNILTVHDVGSKDGQLFLVTELLEGQTVRQVAEGGPLGYQEACQMIRQVAEGLEAAHAEGLVHRDLKPENLFVTRAGVVKILDFGLAKEFASVGENSDPSRAPTLPLATAAGTVMGTAGYMAPEQVRAEPTDPRTDLFAVGCVLYELISGWRAFSAETAVETMTAVLREEPLPLAEAGVEVDPRLDRILRRCLAKDPGGRYASARELAADLRDLEGEPRSAARSDPERSTRTSVAVLPFVNLSGDPEQEYFCDGMAEEIINALAHVDGLQVVARSSSFAFKGRNEDMRAIGSQLGVVAVLEGSVRKSGDRLRITAQLIDVADGYHLWSERFERRLEDVFAIQDEISLAVVDRLKVTLLDGEKSAIVRRYTEDLDAYNLYLEGLHHWHKLTPEGYERSLECFERVLELDPGFVPALVWIGIWHISQCFWADLRPAEGMQAAREYAARALDIDPEHPDAHSLLGVVIAFFQRDREAGEASLRRAIELGPNLGHCHGNLAIHLLSTGRIDEAIEEVRAAQRLDPLSVTNNSWAGGWLAYAGRLDEGLEQLERTIEMHRSEWLPHHQLSEVHMICTRDLESARVESQRAVELSGGVSVAQQQLAGVLYRLGRVEEADRIRRQLEERAETSYIAPTFLANIALARGDVEAALEYLEEAADCQDPWLNFTRLVLPSIRDLDPRVPELLDRLGI